MSLSQKIECALAKSLRDRGYKITDDGDLYAVMRRSCVMAMAGEPCAGRGDMRISLTEIAREVESGIAA
jgi:hypothetical protein